MATKASRIALAGSNISSTGEVDADLLDNTDSSAFLSLDSNGRLGIGTASPSTKLTVKNNNSSTSFGDNNLITLQNLNTTDNSRMGLAFTGNTNIGSGLAIIEAVSYDQSQGHTSLNFSVYNGSWHNDMMVLKAGNVGIGTTDPSRPLDIVASSGANALRLRARSNDDYAFIQFSNYAGTTLRGQIYSHQTTGSIGFTTGTDTSAGDDLYISDSGGVGINTTTTGGYNGRLTVYQDTHDAYTPNGFLDKPTMQLRHTANTDGYTGTRYANDTGTYEWFTGAHSFDGQRADFVTQGYDRDLSGYRENQRIHDTGQIVQPRQPSFIAHKTSHLTLSGSGYSEAGSWSTTHVSGGHNVGGCFNTSTGRFTAPVAGRYKFDANIMHGRTSGDFQIWLCVNGNTSNCVRSNSMQDTGGNWKQTAVTGIFNLAASDYISIFVRSSAAEQYAMYGSASSAFTTCNGYLIG